MIRLGHLRHIPRGGAVVPKPVALACLVSLALVATCAGSVSSGPHRVTIPDAWQTDISVGELTVDGNAFYGVPWFFGLYPAIRLRLPIENLTAATLYVNLNYRTESKTKGHGNSGFGACYMLGPHEKRLIDTVAPIASTTRPIRFILRMRKPVRAQDTTSSERAIVVTIDPFRPSSAALPEIGLKKVGNEDFEVEEVRLLHSEDRGNLVVFKVRNVTNRDLTAEAYVAVNDPMNIETKGVLARPRGFFSDTIETIPAKQVKSISIHYEVPPVAPDPVLVFTVFKPHKEGLRPGERDSRKWDMTLLSYGSFDLEAAAKRKECVIPVYPPMEERIKLTAQTESEHLLFKYRPASYAEQNIEKAIADREAAYDKLSTVLHMELPVTVRIDLYPDMEAKALGSGTTWTPANTRNNKHICEVYNKTYQCDPFHELAHIFSYHFPGYGSNRGGIVEAFAAYFEPHNMPAGKTRQILKQQLSRDKLMSLDKVLLSDSSGQELVVLIDFLLKKDVEKFKDFYVRVTRTRKRKDIEKASQQVYGTDLKGLEEQWHQFIKQDRGI